MKKDYNANSTVSGSDGVSSSSSSGIVNGGGNLSSAESEDEEDPRTPTSVSSQGSQGYDSAGSNSDYVDIEGFTSIQEASVALPELNLQVGMMMQHDATSAQAMAGGAQSLRFY